MAQATSQTDYVFSGVNMRCILTGKETNRSFCLFENHSPGSSGTPVHRHEFEDETIVMYEGEMLAVLNGVPHPLTAGQALFMPRGIPHQLRNVSGFPARYGILCTPSGFEAFVAEAGHVMEQGEIPLPPTPIEIQTMKEAAPRFGIHLLPGFPQES